MASAQKGERAQGSICCAHVPAIPFIRFFVNKPLGNLGAHARIIIIVLVVVFPVMMKPVFTTTQSYSRISRPSFWHAFQNPQA